MPAQFTINLEHEVVFSYAGGELTVADVDQHMQRLSTDPRFNPRLRQIFDFSDVSKVDFAGPKVQQFAERNIFSPDSTRALVVASTLHFGFARMYSIYRDLQGESNIHVFRKLSQAISFIGVPAEVTAEAFSQLQQACHK